MLESSIASKLLKPKLIRWVSVFEDKLNLRQNYLNFFLSIKTSKLNGEVPGSNPCKGDNN